MSSKSTDKLEIMRDIVSNLEASIPACKMEKLKGIDVNWESVSIDSVEFMPCPTLNVEFFE